jgi:hypothetical protein
MKDWVTFEQLSIHEQVQLLYREAAFVMAIRYYRYKVNLYLYGKNYLEVFYNHKRDCIEKISPLPKTHTRLKFYSDQIKIRV